jgi:hypothetical protein
MRKHEKVEYWRRNKYLGRRKQTFLLASDWCLRAFPWEMYKERWRALRNFLCHSEPRWWFRRWETGFRRTERRKSNAPRRTLPSAAISHWPWQSWSYAYGAQGAWYPSPWLLLPPVRRGGPTIIASELITSIEVATIYILDDSLFRSLLWSFSRSSYVLTTKGELYIYITDPSIGKTFESPITPSKFFFTTLLESSLTSKIKEVTKSRMIAVSGTSSENNCSLCAQTYQPNIPSRGCSDRP